MLKVSTRFLSVIGASMVVLAACSSGSQVQAQEQSVSKWVADFKAEAAQKGISRSLLDEAFRGFKPNARIIRLDRKQPEGTKTFTQYMKAVLPGYRVEKGRKLYQQNKTLLNEIGNKYGVQPRFIVALWGIETSYGKITGGFNVPHALATLAYDGRRAEFFRKELHNSLKIINDGHITFRNMKGSWAGAMGQSQFMPSSFLSYAVDYDGDGRRDIWTTKADIFASIANYLSKSGWDNDLTWGRPVQTPTGFTEAMADIKTKRPMQEWTNIGVRKSDGSALADRNINASVIYPGKPTEQAYMIYDNYHVILKWNRSRYFATAVGTLSDRIGWQ